MSPNYSVGSWNLSDILPNPAAADSLFVELESVAAEIESIRPRLNNDLSEADFKRVLQHKETIGRGMYRILNYASLWFSENTQNQEALAFLGKVEQRATELQNRLLFFNLWWKALPAESANRLLAAAPDSARYAYYHQRLASPYALTEPVEQVINLKDVNGANGLITVYDMLTNAYQFTLQIGEERKTGLSREALMQHVQGAVPALREAAYQELYRQYAEDGPVLAQLYMHLVRDIAAETVQLRGYASPISARNLGNDIPDAAVETMLTVIRNNAPIFQNWFRQKAKILGIPTLRRYDLYAPLNPADRTYDFSEAVALTLDSFDSFAPELGNAARRVFDQNHVHSSMQPGKRSGAFCASVGSQITPYVLINYTGKARHVATLAHELGHAAHAILAEHHSIHTFHSSLPMAETASVFAEMLLTETLLNRETDSELLRDLLARTIDDTYATVMRQAYFVLFEKKAHELIRDGAGLDVIREAYLANLQEQFQDSVLVSPEFAWEWVSIPHIYHTPFYCYAYSFGQLLVLALYQQYRLRGKEFVPTYLKILSYGGSASPITILSEAGIDITDAAFWQGGFDFIQGLIDQVAALS